VLFLLVRDIAGFAHCEEEKALLHDENHGIALYSDFAGVKYLYDL
jgi:hypothetical protein